MLGAAFNANDERADLMGKRLLAIVTVPIKFVSEGFRVGGDGLQGGGCS